MTGTGFALRDSCAVLSQVDPNEYYDACIEEACACDMEGSTWDSAGRGNVREAQCS